MVVVLVLGVLLGDKYVLAINDVEDWHKRPELLW